MSPSIKTNQQSPSQGEIREANSDMANEMRQSPQRVNIIVPIYGVEKYLHRCVDGLLKQTYRNIRVILVDDESPDDCPAICNWYASKDSRVIALRRSNGGQSAARNSGLDYVFEHSVDSTNELIAFVDPDDWADMDYVSFLFSLLDTTHADVAQCGHYVSYSEAREEDKNSDHSTKMLTREEAMESVCRNGIWDVTVWNKLYRMSVWQNLRFPEGKLYEDTSISYRIVANATRLVVNMTPKYHYTQRYDSTANGVMWKDSKYDFLEAGDEMAQWVTDNYPQLKNAAVEKQVFVRLSTLSQMVNTKHRDLIREREMRQFIIKHAGIILKDRKAAKRDKVGVLALLLGYPCYQTLWRLYYAFKRHR